MNLFSILGICLFYFLFSISIQGICDTIPLQRNLSLHSNIVSGKSIDLNEWELLTSYQFNHEDLYDFHHHQLQGRILDYYDDTILVEIHFEDIQIEKKAMSMEQHLIYYDQQSVRKVAIKDLSRLEFSLHSERVFLGVALSGLSFFSMLFLAPLVNYQFRDGTFNSSGYINWIKWSGAGLGCGFSLMALFHGRTIVLDSGSIQQGTAEWRIQRD